MTAPDDLTAAEGTPTTQELQEAADQLAADLKGDPDDEAASPSDQG